tara:strand:- start:26 stop:2830 length:2805 start_codon:yes stop_codon:yes gene_type:complete
MNPLKYAQMMKYLTRAKKANPDLPDVFPASKAPIPPKTQNVEEIEAINRFNRDNPRTEKAGGGMLVQPSADGSRPGYAKVKSVKNIKGTDRTTFVRAALDEDQLSTFKNYLNQRDDFDIPDLNKKSELEIKKWFDSKNLSDRFSQIKSDVKQNKINIDTVNVGSKKMSSDRFKQLNWIATNSKKYTDPNKFINAFKTKFKVKDLSKASLFSEASLGGGQQKERKKITLNVLNNSKNKITSYGTDRNYFTFLPGYSEAEIFKAAMVQNNPQVVKNLTNSFNLIEKEFLNMKNMMSEKGVFTATVEEALELKLKGKFKYLNNFDILPGTTEDPGLLGRGIFRTSLENNGISAKAISMYSALNMNANYMSNIIRGLETNPDAFGTIYQLKPNEIKKVVNGWKKVESGQASAKAWVDQMDKILGEKGFNDLFGNVIFEHKVAKKFGKTWTYFPRDYLLQGQFSNSEFNTAKFNAFDKPMIKLIQKYENAPLSRKPIIKSQMETLLSDFNKVSNNYMGDYGLNFDGGKFKFVDKSERVPFGNANRYAKDKSLAAQEMYDTATKGFNVEKLKATKFRKEQLNAIKKYDLKQKEFLNRLKPPPGSGAVTLGALDVGSMFKRLSPATRKLVSGTSGFILPEVLFYQFDKINRMSKGQSEKEAAAGALESGTIGLYDNKAYMEELEKVAESMGIDSNSFDSAYQLNVLNKNYQQNSKNVDAQIATALENQDLKTAEKLRADFNKYLERIKPEFERLQNDISDRITGGSPLTMVQGRDKITQEKFEKPFYDMQDVALEKLKREKIKAYPTQSRQVDTAAGNIGENFYQAFDSLTQGAKNLLQSRIIPFGPDRLRPLESEREKEARYLKDMSGQELYRYNKDFRNLTIDDPITAGDFENLQYEQPGVFFAGGGIAKLAGEDSGPPPESGPNPQGLPALLKRVRNI